MDPVSVIGYPTLQATYLSAAGRHPKVPSGWDSSLATRHDSAVRGLSVCGESRTCPEGFGSARLWSGPLPGVVRYRREAACVEAFVDETPAWVTVWAGRWAVDDTWDNGRPGSPPLWCHRRRRRFHLESPLWSDDGRPDAPYRPRGPLICREQFSGPGSVGPAVR